MGSIKPARPLMFRDHQFVTIPVHDDVQAELSEFFADHMIELVDRLAPFGVDPHDIAIPRFETVLYETEGTTR